jgi:hypothetical protein
VYITGVSKRFDKLFIRLQNKMLCGEIIKHLPITMQKIASTDVSGMQVRHFSHCSDSLSIFHQFFMTDFCMAVTRNIEVAEDMLIAST